VHKREFVLAKTRLCYPQIKILSEYTSLLPGCLASSEESGWSLFWKWSNANVWACEEEEEEGEQLSCFLYAPPLGDPLRCISDADVKDPAERFLVRSLLLADFLAVLSARCGVGKSSASLSLVSCSCWKAMEKGEMIGYGEWICFWILQTRFIRGGDFSYQR
jgi:hypothetical protein